MYLEYLEQIKLNRTSVISAEQSKKVFLRSSGVRHRKWKLLGVKLPDFTVGMSSHCLIWIRTVHVHVQVTLPDYTITTSCLTSVFLSINHYKST